MAIGTITVVLATGIIALLLLGVPLAFSTGAMSLLLILTGFGSNGLALVSARIFGLMSDFAFVAVPMFVLMGTFLEKSGVTGDLFRAMHIIGGRLRGGLAIQTLVVAVVMAAMSGIIGGEIILLGLLALPEMLKRGYDRRLAIGVVCAGGSLGTMIPPSIVLIIYGLTTETSVGDLFLATLVPGLMLAAMYMAYVLAVATIHPGKAPAAGAADLDIPAEEKRRVLLNSILPVLVVAWVMTCIYSGIASINEAAAMGAIGALAAAAAKGTLTRGLVVEAGRQCLRICGTLMWIVFGATALIGVYNLFGGTAYISGAIEGLDVPPLALLFLMMAILFVLGMFMDWVGILLLTMPIFVPTVVSLGYDPTWFGVVFAMNMQMSYLTPPFGPAAFYLKSVAPPEISMGDIYRSFWPFIGLQALAITLLILFPGIALWLPSVLG